MICDLKEIRCCDFYSWYHVSIEQKLYQRTGNINHVCLHLALENFNSDIFHIQYGFRKEDSIELICSKVRTLFSAKDGNIVIDYYKVIRVTIEWFESIEWSDVPFVFKDEILYDSRKIECSDNL